MRDHPFHVNLSGAYLNRVDLSHTTLYRANLSRANFTKAVFRGADFKDAKLDETVLLGADLKDVKNLTVEQLRRAVIDQTTILPSYLAFDQIKFAA